MCSGANCAQPLLTGAKLARPKIYLNKCHSCTQCFAEPPDTLHMLMTVSKLCMYWLIQINDANNFSTGKLKIFLCKSQEHTYTQAGIPFLCNKVNFSHLPDATGSTKVLYSFATFGALINPLKCSMCEKYT